MLYVKGVVGTSLLGDVVITAFARHLLYPILIAVKNETFGFFALPKVFFIKPIRSILWKHCLKT